MTTTLFEMVNFVRCIKSKTKMMKKRLAMHKKYQKKNKLIKLILKKYHLLRYKKAKDELKIGDILKRNKHIIDECLCSRTICTWFDFNFF